MNERLTYLMRRYLDKTASTQEIDEFRTLAGLPEHEELVKTEIEKALGEYAHPTESEAIIGKSIYTRIEEENSVHEKGFRISWPLVRIVAAAILVFTIGIGWYFSAKEQRHSESAFITKTEGHNNKIYKNKNYIKLPDGSTVMLKDSSELIVMEKNGKFLREVILKGEAFFDISHNPARSFVVHTDKVNTRVLGTAFNVRTVLGKVEVKVTRGLVEVAGDKMIFGRIKASEQIHVNTDSNVFSITPLKPIEKVPIATSSLNFEETNLTEVFDQIAKKYNYQIYLENPELGPCRISANFTGKEDLEYVLETVCAIRDLEYSTDLDKILIKGGVSCK